MRSRQIIFASRPKGMPGPDNFVFEEYELPQINEGELLLQSMFISVDPYMHERMNYAKSYVPPFELGKPLAGGVVAKVIESKSANQMVRSIDGKNFKGRKIRMNDANSR